MLGLMDEETNVEYNTCVCVCGCMCVYFNILT
jgi:hypothetical protein